MSVDDPSSLRLDPSDFQLYMNPRVLAETVAHDHKWEFCLSFPQLRCLVRRPIGVHVSYLNEDGDEVTQKLYDFHARMFLHELDHLKGRTMMHWRLSEGNIDILRGLPQEDHENLLSTVQFYKEKIDAMKKDFVHMFEEQRRHDTVVDMGAGGDGHEWRVFETQDTMHDRATGRIFEFEEKLAKQAPDFEETMVIDTIRAIRQDRKERAKR